MYKTLNISEIYLKINKPKMPRGWGRGMCWYYILQGKIPKVEINGEEIPIYPGRGMGWYIFYKILSKKDDYKEELKKELEEVRELKRKLEEILKKLENKI